MNKTQSKRLLNVARALREAHAAKKKFDMSRYVFGDENAVDFGSYDYESRCSVDARNKEENFCGTPACALGHYGARTDLQRIMKVSYNTHSFGVKFADLVFFGTKDESVNYDDDRLEDHFGLNSSEMRELFDYDGCGDAKTSLQAAKYIERFVAKKMYPGRSSRDS